MMPNSQEDLLHGEITQRLNGWAVRNNVASDHIVQSLAQDLSQEENLAIWAGMDPFEYLPQPYPTIGNRFFNWAKQLANIMEPHLPSAICHPVHPSVHRR